MFHTFSKRRITERLDVAKQERGEIMDIKDKQYKQEKREIQEHKKHPMINLADSINHSTIGGLSNLTKGNRLTKIMTVLTVVLILVFIGVYPVLFQEGNPLPILKGITVLNIKENKVVQISDEPQRYLTKTDKGSSPITDLMEKEGWKFDEQLGAGYFFSKGDSKLIIISTQYTRKYRIWKFQMED